LANDFPARLVVFHVCGSLGCNFSTRPEATASFIASRNSSEKRGPSSRVLVIRFLPKRSPDLDTIATTLRYLGPPSESSIRAHAGMSGLRRTRRAASTNKAAPSPLLSKSNWLKLHERCDLISPDLPRVL
jgi:hypothetical protein